MTRLLAPDLLIAEVGNVLWKKTRYHEINSDDARAIIHAITVHCPLTIIPAIDLMPAALDIALNMGLTVYDSLYLALTIAAKAILITADSELVKLAAKSPFSEQTVLLQ
ncbi:MAG: type II toxin-antitoxin system VapC family toxin [Bacillota bacterium]|nr:type II toxin-antitoxin system VapC family toxin [Bacillota bacterium]